MAGKSSLVAVLGASNKTFVKAFPDQSLKSWIEAHIDSFQFFKGVPKAVVPDNLKAGVSRACRYDPEKNPSYLSLAEHYGTAILPTRARKPKDKAKVEVGVQIAQRWILAILRRKIFTSIYQINAEISALLELMNNKVMKHLQVSRNELFEKFEKPMLKELPPSSFEMPSWKEAKVNIDYHIEFSKHYYSVPFRYVGQQVRIKVTRSLVEIFYKDEIIATHKREEHLIKRYTTLSQHMPPQHQEHVKWTPERILEWAQKSGPSTRKLCEVVISKRAHPEQAFRACLGILRLGNKFGEDRLESASTLALHIGNCYYRTIETILKSGKDKVGVQVLKGTDCKIPIHENIRGSSYYN